MIVNRSDSRHPIPDTQDQELRSLQTISHSDVIVWKEATKEEAFHI